METLMFPIIFWALACSPTPPHLISPRVWFGTKLHSLGPMNIAKRKSIMTQSQRCKGASLYRKMHNLVTCHSKTCRKKTLFSFKWNVLQFLFPRPLRGAITPGFVLELPAPLPKRPQVSHLNTEISKIVCSNCLSGWLMFKQL